jgi:hypothetical protein
MIWALVRRYDVSLKQKTVERSLVIGAWRAVQDTGIFKIKIKAVWTILNGLTTGY